MKLSPSEHRFIVHWGEMGSRWGINRTVAQIHALLYLSPEPLTADVIADVLSVARSNVSTSLKELLGWGLVKVVHQLGDRRDHFETLEDVWRMFRIILEERKKREIDPTLAVLRECAVEAAAEKNAGYAAERLQEMLEFFESTATWYAQIRKLPDPAVVKFLKMGAKVPKLLGVEKR